MFCEGVGHLKLLSLYFLQRAFNQILVKLHDEQTLLQIKKINASQCTRRKIKNLLFLILHSSTMSSNSCASIDFL